MKKLILLVAFGIWCLPLTAGWTPAQLRQAKPNVASGGLPPAYERVDGQDDYTITTGNSTIVVPIATQIEAGKHAAIAWTIRSSSLDVSSIVDSSGNTWTVRVNRTWFGSKRTFIASAPITTQLDAADEITITLSGAVGSDQGTWGQVFVLENVNASAPVDQTAQNDASGTAITCSAATTAANTAIIGVVCTELSSPWTYSGANFNIIGGAHVNGTDQQWYLQEDQSSAGTYDMGGTLQFADDWVAMWVAFK